MSFKLLRDEIRRKRALARDLPRIQSVVWVAYSVDDDKKLTMVASQDIPLQGSWNAGTPQDIPLQASWNHDTSQDIPIQTSWYGGSVAV